VTENTRNIKLQIGAAKTIKGKQQGTVLALFKQLNIRRIEYAQQLQFTSCISQDNSTHSAIRL